MRNAAAAEWILSLVSDNSASTVGDLVEEASSRGALWFWSGVLRTAGSHLWRGSIRLSAVHGGAGVLGSSGDLVFQRAVRDGHNRGAHEYCLLGETATLGLGMHRRSPSRRLEGSPPFRWPRSASRLCGGGPALRIVCDGPVARRHCRHHEPVPHVVLRPCDVLDSRGHPIPPPGSRKTSDSNIEPQTGKLSRRTATGSGW